jgi:hypothetical protein
LGWCDEDAFENLDRIPRMIHHATTWATYFTIDNSAFKVDLVAATADKTCPGEYGVTINVTEKTMKVPSGVRWSGKAWNNDTCAVVANSTPTPTPDPCRAHIDKTAVASIEASVTARRCRGIDPQTIAPRREKNPATQLAVAGVSCLLAAVGALGLFLA